MLIRSARQLTRLGVAGSKTTAPRVLEKLKERSKKKGNKLTILRDLKNHDVL
jgi:hypothetical protein